MAITNEEYISAGLKPKFPGQWKSLEEYIKSEECNLLKTQGLPITRKQ